jgi:hypothetical protein
MYNEKVMSKSKHVIMEIDHANPSIIVGISF